jgi:hypothetical protein
MQGGKNWILPKWIYANRFLWDAHWLEIRSNHLCPSMGPNGGSVAMYSGDRRLLPEPVGTGLAYVTLAVEWPMATQETGGSFLSQFEPVWVTLPWLWTGHTGEKWLLPEPVETGLAYGTFLAVDCPHWGQIAPSLASWNQFRLCSFP